MGAGRWGHLDLAGGMWEWGLDWYSEGWYSGVGNICSNCANLSAASDRVFRGGGGDYSGGLRAANRNKDYPTNRDNNVGIRCARTP